MKNFKLFLVVFYLNVIFSAVAFAQTSILKWQDGKNGCVTLTFDDGSINQFRIAIPLMKNRGLHATFFIITGDIPGSKYQPTFIGRPIKDIINESRTVPTGKNNLFERCSALYYLAHSGNYPEIKSFSDLSVGVGEQFEQGNLKEVYSIIDTAFIKLKENGEKRYKIEKAKNNSGKEYHLTWDILRMVDKEGDEIANHTVSHPYMPLLDKANILYEIEKSGEDIQEQTGHKVFSIECPYGIDDKRVLECVYPEFPFVRNGLKDKFIKEILRGEPGEPVSKDKEYVQWQRGPLSHTRLNEMTGWVDTTIKDSAWLLLVFHGVEGIGWEALTKKKIETYFDYIKKNENKLWIATFQDSYKYVRERMNAKIKSINDAGIITITLSHDLDKKIYDLPLTLKTNIPDNWILVKIKQGDKNIEIPVIKGGNGSFIKYRAMPNGSNIEIKKIK